jgi:hypothetical protein
VRFLKSLEVYGIKYEKKDIGIREEVNMFNLGQKVKEYQRNYPENIIKTPIYRIPCKLITTVKEEKSLTTV